MARRARAAAPLRNWFCGTQLLCFDSQFLLPWCVFRRIINPLTNIWILLLQSRFTIVPASVFILILILVTLCRSKQQCHVPSPSLNSNFAEVSVGSGLCINTGYIIANMILACSQGLGGTLIVWALTLTSTLTYLPHHSHCLPLPLFPLFLFSSVPPLFFLFSQ